MQFHRHRRDLRVADNRALAADDDPVVPVFVFDPRFSNTGPRGEFLPAEYPASIVDHGECREQVIGCSSERAALTERSGGDYPLMTSSKSLRRKYRTQLP